MGVNRRLLDVVAAFLSDRARDGDISSARNQHEPTISQRTATFRASAPGIDHDLAHPPPASRPCSLHTQQSHSLQPHGDLFQPIPSQSCSHFTQEHCLRGCHGHWGATDRATERPSERLCTIFVVPNTLNLVCSTVLFSPSIVVQLFVQISFCCSK